MNEVLRFFRVSADDYRHGGINALSFSVYEGETVVLAGLNNSGIKTILELLSGAKTDYTGEIVLVARDGRTTSLREASKGRVRLIDATTAVYENLSVQDNLILGRGNSNVWQRVDCGSMFAQMQDWFDLFQIDPSQKELTMTRGFEKKKVELLRALWGGAQIIVLSDLAYYCNEKDAVQLSQILSQLNRVGISVILEYDNLFPFFQKNANRCIMVEHGNIAKTFFSDEWEKWMLWENDRAICREDTRMPPVRTDRVGTGANMQIEDCRTGRKLNFASGRINGIYDREGAIPRGLERFLQFVSRRFTVRFDKRLIQLNAIPDLLSVRASVISHDACRKIIFSNLSPAENACIFLRQKIPGNRLYSAQMTRYLFHALLSRYPVLEPLKMLEDNADCRNISFDMEYRLLIAKWLMFNPKVVVLFSPLGNNDLTSRAQYVTLQKQLSRENKTVIVISRNLNDLIESGAEIHEI